MGYMREMRLLPGIVNDITAIQEDRGLEQSVRDQMKHRQREGAQATLYDHIAHLADRREPQGLLDVVLGQHHRRTEDSRQRSNDKSQVQRRRTQCEQRRNPVNQESSGVDERELQERVAGGRSEERAG